MRKWISMGRMAWSGWLALAPICGPVLTQPCTADSGLGGTWGGEHIRMVVSEAGAAVEYDCAVGAIDEPLKPDREGIFEARGTYVFERGGPRYQGEPPPKKHPASYRGWTDGSEMRLTVTLLDEKKDMGTFSLGRGRRAVLEKCL